MGLLCPQCVPNSKKYRLLIVKKAYILAYSYKIAAVCQVQTQPDQI